MNIYELANDIARVSDELEKLNDIVSDRWRLLRVNCYGHFESWRLDGDNVIVTYGYQRREDGYDEDIIPAMYFTEDDAEKAVKLWEEVCESRRVATQKAKAEELERAERETLERLSQKYNGDAK